MAILKREVHMQGKITKRLVDTAVAVERDKVIWDTDLPGFGLRCRAGGAKFYVLKYRAGGRARWYTIGRHGGPWTPATARREARRLLGEVAAGRDPAGLRDAGRRALTVVQLGERFLSDYVPHHCKLSTAREYRRSVELFITPALGRHAVSDVTRADVARLHHDMRDTPYQANRTLGVLHKMFNLAEMWVLRPDGTNPCRHVQKFKERRRERFLTEDELARLGDALIKAERDEIASAPAIAALRLLMFTGARLSEILTLRWDFVNETRQCLALPDSKTGPKILYLNPPALDVLAALPRVEGNPYVIVGYKSGGHLADLQKPWRRIRKLADLNDLRIHDLRHSFASIGVAGGLSLPIIGKLLGHSQAATTYRYAHLADDPVRQASDMISAKIATAIGRTNNRKDREISRQSN